MRRRLELRHQRERRPRIRQHAARQIIRALPLSEKIRLINLLSKFPFLHRDVVAIEKIYHNSTADELRAEP